VFFARRYLLIIIVIVFPDDTFKQLMLSMHGSLFVTVYTVVARPFDEPIMNKQEVMNEVAVCAFSYSLYAYTNIITERE